MNREEMFQNIESFMDILPDIQRIKEAVRRATRV